jgi:hypothetical protein
LPDAHAEYDGSQLRALTWASSGVDVLGTPWLMYRHRICRELLFLDGKTRCVPDDVASVTYRVFSDPGCTKRVLLPITRGCAPPVAAIESAECGVATAYDLEPALFTSSYFWRNEAGICSETKVPDSVLVLPLGAPFTLDAPEITYVLE